MIATSKTPCSFCGKSRDDGRRTVIVGKAGAICDVCVALADSPFARIAHCASCTPVNEKHDPMCPETRR